MSRNVADFMLERLGAWRVTQAKNFALAAAADPARDRMVKDALRQKLDEVLPGRR